MSMTGLTTAFGLGFVYFIASIPAGAAAGAWPWAAALAAWLGYSAGAAVVIAAGAPLRDWLVAKLGIPATRDPGKLVWRIWDRAGLAGLGLVAPVTIGPQAGAVIALAAGERPLRTLAALSAGVLPWCAAFALLTAFGVKLVR